MNYFNVGQLKKVLNNIEDTTYVAIGTKENNEIDEIRKEAGIIDARMKNIGFDSSNGRYLKLYINQYDEGGCLRFTR